MHRHASKMQGSARVRGLRGRRHVHLLRYYAATFYAATKGGGVRQHCPQWWQRRRLDDALLLPRASSLKPSCKRSLHFIATVAANGNEILDFIEAVLQKDFKQEGFVQADDPTDQLACNKDARWCNKQEDFKYLGVKILATLNRSN